MVWTVRLGLREQVAVTASRLYTFGDAMPGLPDSHRFALISDDAYAPLQWLQSLDEWEICLPVLPLEAIDLPGYAGDVQHALGAGAEWHDSRILFVTHLGESSIAVNSLAPIVLDADKGTAVQVILEGGTRQKSPAPTGAGSEQANAPCAYVLRQHLAWDRASRMLRPSC